MSQLSGLLGAQGQQDLMTKMTAQTLQLFKDASSTTGWNTGLGLTGFGLENVAKLLFPVVTPFRNTLPRPKAPAGAGAARWKAIVGYGSSYSRQRPTLGFGYAGSIVDTVEQDFVAPYQPLSLGDSVQLDAQILAQGFDDLRAKAGVKLLYELMVGEDIIALGGQSFALQQPTSPTLVYSSTGGSMGTAGTYYVGVACRTLENYWYNSPATATGGQTNNANATVTVPSAQTTGSVTASVTYVPGAFVYDWYMGTAANTMYYVGSSSTNTYTITAIPTTGQLAPSADASADANAFNGLAATLVGSYTSSGMATRGTSNARDSGAFISSLDGATMTASAGTISQIDAVLQQIYAAVKVSPTRMLVNPQQAADITDLTMGTGSNSIVRVILPDEQGPRSGLTAGQYVDSYVNKAANGQVMKIVTDPQVPPGHIFLITDVLPFPDASVDSVLSIETQADYMQYEYGINRNAGAANGGPRYDFETRCIEVLKNYGPAFMGIIHNVGTAA